MDIFLARQPILDKQQNVVAYELLFRSGHDNYYDHTDGDHATSTVLSHSFLSIGMEEVTRSKLAFVNFTRNLLVNEVVTLFPSDFLVVEILENVQPDQAVLDVCRRYKQLGYRLALDDFVFRPEFVPLLKLVDIVKIDFTTASSEAKEKVREVISPETKLLAEKIESKEEFDLAKQLGYSYFQGYFFARPDILARKNIPAHKMNHLRVLQVVNKPDIDFDQLEEVFKQDVALSYKLLNYLNSAYFGLPGKVRSIRHALTLLGLKEARKWLSLIALCCIGKDKSEELVVSSLFRANMCEMIAPLAGLGKDSAELFLVGLFSLLEAFLDQPMEVIISHLPLPAEIRDALLGKTGPYSAVLNLVVAYERGDWNQVFSVLSEMNSVAPDLPGLFIKTVERCNKLLPAM